MYWTGGTSADWGTVANWTGTANIVPSNDGAFFQNDKFSERFKTDADNKYVVTFSAAKVNTWNTYFNNCGTAENPIILRATAKSYGLTTGEGTNKSIEGLYIGTNLRTGADSADGDSAVGNAYVRFENGTFKTGSWATWFIGNGTYAGHVVAVGSTIESSHQFRLYNGSFTASNCTFAVNYSNSYIGDSNGKTGTMKFVNSTATFNGAELRLGSCDGSSGELIVESGTVSCGKWLEVGYKGKAKVVVGGGEGNSTATLTITSEDIIFGKWLVPEAATNSVTVKTGGTLCARNVRYHNGNSVGEKSMAHFIFDGGTLKLQADSDLVFQSDNSNKRQACTSNPVALSKKFKVYVTANGGTIDTQGKLLASPIPFEGAPKSAGGGMTFKGGGTFTNEVDSTYTGLTMVELGTKLVVNSAASLGGGLGVVLPVNDLAQGVYTLAEIAPGSNAVFDDSAIASVLPPADCELRLSAGKKSIICLYKTPSGVWIGDKSNDLCDGDNWSDGVVPDGRAATILVSAAATLQCGGTFSPESITFHADSALVTVSGPGAISGISSIVNNTSLHHVFNCQVTCPDGITPSITRTYAAYMTFVGGITMFNNPKTGGGTTDFWSGKIAITTTAEQMYYTGGNAARLVEGTVFSFNNGYLDRMLINPGATAVVERLVYNGCAREANKGWFSAVFDNGDGVIRTGEVRAQGDAVLFHSYAGADMRGGTIIADKLTCAQTKKTSGSFPYPQFFLNCGAVAGGGLETGGWNGEGVWVIGPGGLAFGDGSTLYASSAYEVKVGKNLGGRPAATLYSFADWKLHARPGGGQAMGVLADNGSFLVIDTSHYTIGESEYDSATSHTVTLDGIIGGGGAIRVVGNGKVVFNSASTFSGGLTISNAATVAVNAGCKPGNGAVLVTSGGTLAVPQSDEVTIPGAVTLQDGAILSFNFTSADAAPKFKFTNAAGATVESGGTVNVKVSAASGVYPRNLDGKWLIATNVSGSFELVDPPTWAESVSVEEGSLYLNVKAPGLSLSVR